MNMMFPQWNARRTEIETVDDGKTHPDVAKWMASGELTVNTSQQCRNCGKIHANLDDAMYCGCS